MYPLTDLQLMDPAIYLIVTVWSAGWVLVGWLVRKLFRGELATNREINEKNRELQELKGKNAVTAEQDHAMLLAIGPLLNTVLTELRQAIDRGEVGSAQDDAME